jgi:hypothetical protein
MLLAAVASIHPIPRIMIFGGDHSAQARLPSGAIVRVDMSPVFLTHLAEYERRLSVCSSFWRPCARRWLHPDWGGARQINLYRRKDGVLVITDHTWMMEIDEVVPAIRLYDYKQEEAARARHSEWNCRDEAPAPKAPPDKSVASVYFKDLEYLGMFEFFSEEYLKSRPMSGEFRFASSHVHGEHLCCYPSRG